MDVRIEGLHEEALNKLKKINGLKTPVSMVRVLIADAAKEAGVWPDVSGEVEAKPVITSIAK